MWCNSQYVPVPRCILSYILWCSCTFFLVRYFIWLVPANGSIHRTLHQCRATHPIWLACWSAMLWRILPLRCLLHIAALGIQTHMEVEALCHLQCMPGWGNHEEVPANLIGEEWVRFFFMLAQQSDARHAFGNISSCASRHEHFS